MLHVKPLKYIIKYISDPGIITDNLCDFFTNIGVKYANNMSPSIEGTHNYLNLKKTRNCNSIFFTQIVNYGSVSKAFMDLKEKSWIGSEVI